ncbi:hypothetical protein H1R20_g5644, partial [Candolleomyces eurysporus]
MAFFTNLAPFFLFSAFVLLLLVTLSAPIIDPIYLFRLLADVGGSAAGARGSIQFGVFGYCVSAIEASVFGIDNTRDAECSSPRLGYRFDSTVARVLGVSGVTDLISRTLTALLVLNPIATGLTFLAFLTSLFMLRKGANGTARLPSFLTLGVGFLAALITTVAFIANIVIVAVVRNRIRDDLDDSIDLSDYAVRKGHTATY